MTFVPIFVFCMYFFLERERAGDEARLREKERESYTGFRPSTKLNAELDLMT